MPDKAIHQCQCPNCLGAEDHPDKRLHQQINLLVSRLDEQQRRWYVALEAGRLGHGGIELMSKVSGLSVPTIRRGQQELDNDLADRPLERVRQPGGGRKPVEKNNLPLKRP
jgi:hypothetical protein